MTYSNAYPLSYRTANSPLNYYAMEGIEIQELDNLPAYNQTQNGNAMQPYVQPPVGYQQGNNAQDNNQVQMYNQHKPYEEHYQETKTLSPSVKAGLIGAGVGLIGGSIAGAVKKNPYMVNGIPTDKFAQLTYEKYLKKAPEVERLAYNQTNEVLNSIDKVNTVDGLKALLKNNPEASKEVSTALGKPTEKYLDTILDANLSSNRGVIKKKLEAANLTRFQYMKNEIFRAWDSGKRKFIQPADMDNNIFKAIKKVSNAIHSKFILAYAAIAGAVVGTLTYVTHKIISRRRERAQ